MVTIQDVPEYRIHMSMTIWKHLHFCQGVEVGSLPAPLVEISKIGVFNRNQYSSFTYVKNI